MSSAHCKVSTNPPFSMVPSWFSLPFFSYDQQVWFILLINFFEPQQDCLTFIFPNKIPFNASRFIPRGERWTHILLDVPNTGLLSLQISSLRNFYSLEIIKIHSPLWSQEKHRHKTIKASPTFCSTLLLNLKASSSSPLPFLILTQFLRFHLFLYLL